MNRKEILDAIAYAGIEDGARLVRYDGSDRRQKIMALLHTNRQGHWIDHATELRALLEQQIPECAFIDDRITNSTRATCFRIVEEFYRRRGTEPNASSYGLMYDKFDVLNHIDSIR